MKLLRLVYEWFAFYLSLFVLGTIQLGWAFIAFVIRHLVSEERGRAIGRRVISRVFRHFFRFTEALGMLRVDASALDALDQSESLVIAPNHPSVLDALILISRFDNLNCIMKASVLDNILLGSGARLAGYIRNDGPKRMLRLSVQELKRGGQLIIFPEGTRTLAAPVNKFLCGFAAIARVARVPVQTVIIETDTPFLSKGWSVLKKPQRIPMTFRVRLGERFEVGDDVHGFVNELYAYFVRTLADAELGDLRRNSRPEWAGYPAHALARPLRPSRGISPAAAEDDELSLPVHGEARRPVSGAARARAAEALRLRGSDIQS